MNALASVRDKSRLAHSTLYVTLEPCAHHGKTPPCADRIVHEGIPRVVVGIQDPFARVNGLGLEKMRDAGIDVTVGILEDKCRELNKRFFIFHQKKRPYIFLKWAQTSDGFIDAFRDSPNIPPLKITGEETQKYVHRMRSLEQAIMVGTRTALLDNPRRPAGRKEKKSPAHRPRPGRKNSRGIPSERRERPYPPLYGRRTAKRRLYRVYTSFPFPGYGRPGTGRTVPPGYPIADRGRGRGIAQFFHFPGTMG